MTAIVVAGDILVDVLVRIDAPLALESDTPARTTLSGGGSAANVAAWLAATGQDVTFVGGVGDDVLGRGQEADLRALGVRTRMRIDASRPTGTCVVIVTADGRRTMFPDPGAGDLEPDDLPADAFRPGAHLHLSGYSLLRERSREAGLLALEMARAAGMTISVDASSAAPLAAAGPAAFLRWIAGADLLFANQAEATVLTGQHDPVAAGRRLSASVGRAVVLKLGAAGALRVDRTGTVERVPAEVTEIVDTTGAGDAFDAGFLAARLSGSSPIEALAAGGRLAARAVSKVGARPSGGRPRGGSASAS
jgi:sugar/nucleoside kinase (ribokinase family)